MPPFQMHIYQPQARLHRQSVINVSQAKNYSSKLPLLRVKNTDSQKKCVLAHFNVEGIWMQEHIKVWVIKQNKEENCTLNHDESVFI